MVKAPRLSNVLNQTGCNLDFLVGSTRLAFLINGQCHHGSTVLLNQPHNALVAGVGAVAILEVDGVYCAPPAQVLQACLNDGGFGGVNHDGKGGAGGQQARELRHVRTSITPHIVHAQIQHVGTVAGLLLGNIYARFPVPRQHRLPEHLRTVGVGALTNHGNARILCQRHRRIQRGHIIFHSWRALCLLCIDDRVPHRPNMLRGSATTAPHQRKTIIVDKCAQGVAQFTGGQRVFCAVFTKNRQASIRHHGHRDRGVLR